LYRFYKLYPYRADFTNPFAGNLAFYKQELLTLLGFDFDKKKQIADFYFAKNHFDKALEIYENLSVEAPTNAEIYQKIAYSYQSVGNYERALDHYLKAETINHKDSWTLKKLAFCYKMLRQYDNAFAYYEQLSEMAPDNTSHLLNIGHCLLNLGDYEEALKHYFKVEYLSPDNLNARRAVAWCEFLAQKPVQAERYYQKLIDDAPSSDDFLNAGHVQWTSGNSTAALDFYKQSVAAGSLDRFLSAFEQDRELLLQKGIAVDDMPLMLDMLRYKDSL
jgi:tetratricopeptide (TPR) repeat protein